MGAVAREQMHYLAELNRADLGWFDEVCMEIAQGASVTQAYAKVSHSIAVPWPVIRMWFKPNGEMEAKYQDALAARKEWREELARSNVSKIAEVEHADDDVSVGDTLKAAAMVLEKDKEKGAGVAVQINIGMLNGVATTPAVVVEQELGI